MTELLVWSVLALAAMRQISTVTVYVLVLRGTTPQQRPAIIRALRALHPKG
ncbi:hypothetical protein [Catelliglobosispora koreensis]|uniref:hypothetical protein n=1 Tax=Catelliglobosispora koreensis TaxID=129052 RepID=UPI0003668833|nr:hypothetical protein [Catelliglobosispora koreensis]